MNPETRIEQAFVRWCHQRGIPCLKLKAEGIRGFPDRTVFLKKRIVFIEFKTPNGVLSEHQKRMADAMKVLGFEYYVCRSKEDAINVLGPEIAPLSKARSKNGNGSATKRGDG